MLQTLQPVINLDIGKSMNTFYGSNPTSTSPNRVKNSRPLGIFTKTQVSLTPQGLQRVHNFLLQDQSAKLLSKERVCNCLKKRIDKTKLREIKYNEERKKALQSLKTAKGQIDGIIKMIEEERYCMDISNQIVAAQALLKRSNLLILKQHLNHCVKQAVINGESDEKIDEIMTILEKAMSK